MPGCQLEGRAESAHKRADVLFRRHPRTGKVWFFRK